MYARKQDCVDNPVTLAALKKSSGNPSNHSESTVRASFLVACRWVLLYIIFLKSNDCAFSGVHQGVPSQSRPSLVKRFIIQLYRTRDPHLETRDLLKTKSDTFV